MKINEDLKINNPENLNKLIKAFVQLLIRRKIISSYNRKLTSGRMTPNDFVEDITQGIYIALQKQVNNANIKGDKYIQRGVE